VRSNSQAGLDCGPRAQELARLHWTQNDLIARQKNHPSKLALAARLRQETTPSVKQIADRLHLGKPKGARTNLPLPANAAGYLKNKCKDV